MVGSTKEMRTAVRSGHQAGASAENKGIVAYLLFASPDDDAQAEIFLPGQPVGLTLTKTPGDNAGRWIR